MQATISCGIGTSKHHLNKLEGKPDHLYQENMTRLKQIWMKYATDGDILLWDKVISSLQHIWATMAKPGVFKDNPRTKRVFYSFRALLHKFSGGKFPVSTGAFKIHLLEHCYEQMVYYGCTMRCFDECNQESFHKRANEVYNIAKYNKDRLEREKRFLKLLG